MFSIFCIWKLFFYCYYYCDFILNIVRKHCTFYVVTELNYRYAISLLVSMAYAINIYFGKSQPKPITAVPTVPLLVSQNTLYTNTLSHLGTHYYIKHIYYIYTGHQSVFLQLSVITITLHLFKYRILFDYAFQLFNYNSISIKY